MAKIKTTQVDTRAFKYDKGGMTLSFSLYMAEQEGIKDFLDCLKQAVTDVEKMVVHK